MKYITPSVAIYTLANLSTAYSNLAGRLPFDGAESDNSNEAASTSTANAKISSSEEINPINNANNHDELELIIREACIVENMMDTPFCQSLFDERTIELENLQKANKPFPRSASAETIQAFQTFRKLKQMKMLILWLQPEHRFARYCYYGCWCLPDQDHADYTPQYGKPVDKIDASCKKMSQCYDCAKMDYGDKCDSSDVGYKYELIKDENDPDNHWKKSIRCLDDPKNDKKGCKRSICECDKQLAEDLRTNFEFWFEGHHQTQGGFDTSICEVDHKNHNGNSGPLNCCGSKDEPRFPYRDNGNRKCCGNKTYDSNLQECCDNGDVKFIGAC